MAAFDASQYLGDRDIALTAAELAEIDNKQFALFQVNLSKLLRGAAFFTIPLRLATDPNNNTVTGVALPALIPFKVIGVQIGAKTAAGSACTGIIEKDPLGGGAFATMMNAALDIFTDVGTMQQGVILDGAEDIAVGDELRLSITGTGAGAVTGANALLLCLRN